MKQLSNPYREKPATSFWRKSVAGLSVSELDPLISVPFKIGRSDKIATAGSCFAQHIARTLQASGYDYLITEQKPESAGAIDQNYGTFSARFGNVYTIRQMLQLIQRAYGVYRPKAPIWYNKEGRLIDPFRPAIQDGGFETIEALEDDRRCHLAAVRRMFEDCSVFIFTLGLTEGWISSVDGTVFPLAPGSVASIADSDNYNFHNFNVAEMASDLNRFIDLLRSVNSTVKIILTVSPVPLVATFEDQHVLVSNTYSKAALRVVADDISKSNNAVAYFPSFEIIMSPNAKFEFFADDLREVIPEGVDNVMRIFKNHFLGEETVPASIRTNLSDEVIKAEARRLSKLQGVICDEELLDPGP